MTSTHPYRQAYPTLNPSQINNSVSPNKNTVPSVYSSYQHQQPPHQQPVPYQQQQQQHLYHQLYSQLYPQQQHHQKPQHIYLQQQQQRPLQQQPLQQLHFQHQLPVPLPQQQLPQQQSNDHAFRQLDTQKRVQNTHYQHLFDRNEPSTNSIPPVQEQPQRTEPQNIYEHKPNNTHKVIIDDTELDNIPQPVLPKAPASLSGGSSRSSPRPSRSQTPKATDTPKALLSKANWNDDVVLSPLLSSVKASEESSLFGSTGSLPKPGYNNDLSGSSFSMLGSPNFGPLLDSHDLIAQQMSNNPDSLVPKLKTIQLYRQNAKKSHDPEVLFQYARYMLNTAIFMNVDTDLAATTKESNSHKRNKSSVSFFNVLNLDSDNEDPILEDKLLLKEKFLKEAIHYLKKLSDKGYNDAQYLLADAYSSGAIGKTDEKEAFNLFQAAAKHGHIESAYRTSFCYEVGLGTTRDSRKALEFLKFAATKNHPSAMYKMGLYSFYGRMGLSSSVNTKKDGIKWLKRASENANELVAAAPFELGKIHYEGFKDIIIQDKVYALDLFRQAASLGHIQSAAILAKHYEMGDVLPQDPELSIHYYTQAALGGDPESMLGLCGWFMVGSTNLEKNEHEAFEWALKAATKGFPKAQFATGHFLEKGIGCDKNQDAAVVWFQTAAENGDERAIKKLKGTKYEKQDQKKGWVKKIFT